MLGILIVGAIVAQAAMSVPSPSPAPLKEITHVSARTLCVALHDRIGPSILDLTQNDVSIKDAQKILEDYDRLSNWPMLGSVHLENDVTAVAHDMDKIDELLREPSDAATVEGADHATIEQLRAEVRSAVDAQRAELNLFNGLSETLRYSRTANDNLDAGDSMSSGGTPPPSGMSAPNSFPIRALVTAAQQDAAVTANRERQLTVTLFPLTAACQSSGSP